MTRLDPKRSLIVVVDVQERLAPAMDPAAMDELKRSFRILLTASEALSIPLAVTEQYPSGLGHTVAPFRDELIAKNTFIAEKLHFSGVGVLGGLLERQRPSQIIVIGMETHICVFQTVRELVLRGFEVHVPIDGVASRKADHRKAGLDLIARAGATVTTTETVVFDWLGKAEGDAFKALSKAIR